VSLMGHLAPTSSSPFGAIPEGEDSSQQASSSPVPAFVALRAACNRSGSASAAPF
jgi:hypothetical protein